MKTNLLWIVLIFAASLSQWWIIEIKKRKPNKTFWFLMRVIAFSGFMWWYVVQNYMWYWAGTYLVFTFAWLFPGFLNILRCKYFGYMSAKGSYFDRVLLSLGDKAKVESLYFYFGFILMLIAVLLQLFYGKIEFGNI